MTRCQHCGSECILPFTCQHCGGKFCPDCRLPPSHDCAGIGSWNAKPAPATGTRYSPGGRVSAYGGIAFGQNPAPKRTAGGIPYLKIFAGIILLMVFILAWLVLSG